MSRTSGNFQENLFDHKNVMELLGKFGPFCKVREIYPFSYPRMAQHIKIIIFHPCVIIHSVKHIWLKGQRNTRSMINVMFALLANRAFSKVMEGANSKHFSLAPLA